MQARKPSWVNYWGWGSGDLLGAGAQAVVTGWLFYFFTTFCGLNAGEAGLILGLPRLLEAITCPLIGYISDNLRHTWIGRKIGRRKIFLMITVPLLPSFALLFVTGQTFWYYLLAFIFFEFVYTMFLIPWETLAAEMTKDYKEKAKFAGARMIVAQTSAIAASFMPILTTMLAGEGSPHVFLIMAAIFGVLFSLVVVLVIIFSWERPYSDEELAHTPAPPSLKAALLIPFKMFGDLFSTLRIRAFRQHISIYLGGYLSQDIFNTALPIFVATVLTAGAAVSIGEATTLIGALMMTMYFAQLISVIIAIQVAIRTGPTLAYRIAAGFVTVAVLLFGVFYLIQPAGFAQALAPLNGNVLNLLSNPLSLVLLFWLFIPIILAGLGRGTLNFVPWSVYNYLPDIDEAATGLRREGIFAGVMTFTRKFAQSGALIVTGWLINAGGYVATPKKATEFVTQTPLAIQTIVLVIIFGPILMMALGAWASWNFRLNARTHAVLIHEVERLRAGETEPESEDSKRIVEDLTGFKFERLWGRSRKKA
ncbi:major facilitator transporter [Asticcacaulis sp. AC460]|uniref:MFS transporter n=1 Tax=Asticcacaulis sp. AC460 TaxID=1282360 RepID=UPI0003C3FABF|nr:MFS transporter [Asticcacaulis sp. AC460]ESQ93298.1 major facilitator transporter [Asticcacaulis sp. AC460]